MRPGLKCIQGKGIVNSISLKEGEAKFIEQAKLVRRYGAAVIVMAFDEDGQADTRERKTRNLYPQLRDPHRKKYISRPKISSSIQIFFAVATGIDEHNNYAVDFIEATRDIKQSLPTCDDQWRRIQCIVFRSGVIYPVREAIHAVFLYHTIKAGMDMGIVNAGQLAIYDDFTPKSYVSGLKTLS